jgi:hypothetical protein
MQAKRAALVCVEVKSSESGIHFNNVTTKKTNELNVLYYEYIYNGGGVGIGDFNNDSLPDIYFTGNRLQISYTSTKAS